MILNKVHNIDFLNNDLPDKCAKVHIRLILENEIIKPSNNQSLEYYQEVLNEIEKL